MGIGRPFDLSPRWRLGLRAYGQLGTIEGDVTCSADEVAALFSDEVTTERDLVWRGDRLAERTRRRLGGLTLDEIEHLLAEGHFPPGSMGPKIEAALEYLRNGGREVIITSIPKALTTR